jgi:hypothetical protein
VEVQAGRDRRRGRGLARSVSRRPWDQHEKTGSGRAVAQPSRTRQYWQVQLCDVLFLMCIRSHADPAKTHGSTGRPPERAPRFPLWGALGIAGRAV